MRRYFVSDMVSVSKAAEIIGCTEGRVRQLIDEGKIKNVEEISQRIRLVPKAEAERLRDAPSKVGRPRRKSA